ncbi:MAG: iron-containing alcohol dehydrogenase family protein [Bacillota bacterium]|nr:iron-containing alcohol dehydrogenase family protein [Bacillota bacterium]
MITIKTPNKYINEPNILKSAGEYIRKIGKNALIIGGKTALSAVGEEFFNSLTNSDINYVIKEFQGYPTYNNIHEVSSLAAKFKADVIIGIGGGRVLDTIKASGDKSRLPVVTVPTIAATCAAWSALTVVYDESGKAMGYILLEDSPKLILADTKIIAEAPARYLNAGIADTIVKWYEFAPYAVEGNNDFSLRIGLNTSKLAIEILERSAVKASKDSQNKKITKELIEIVDSIIVLAGLVGSISDGRYRAALAHALHNSLTDLSETHESLHGEKVIFGLIVQFLLENKPKEEIDKLIAFLNELKLPVTLSQLGIEKDISNKAFKIAKGVNITAEALDKLTFKVNSKLIEEAIIRANHLGENSLKLGGTL